ncbi:MAG: hypothetical protein IJM44_03465 [Ruminococcus sp.]|nr:hypothetical protein [Ruminococcus sp.]
MHKTLSRGLTAGLIGNILFVLFAFVCFIFYKSYVPDSTGSNTLEVIAYLCLFSGFGMLIFSDVCICRTVRMRQWLKFGFTAYIVMEALMMYLELNSYKYESFYEPYSLMLAILHAVFSAAICLTFVSLDPDKKCLEVMVIITIGMILCGMLGNLMGIRIYFSILTNAVALTVLFASLKYMMKREMIEIDCHGDRARVAEYNSNTFFE